LEQNNKKRTLIIPEEYQKRIDNKKKGYPKNKKLNERDNTEFPKLEL
jgi:hypothetical protein